MVVSADTSFLFSLYGDDAHSEDAVAEVEKLGRPIRVSSLGRFELSNAFRFAASRGFIDEAEADGFLVDFSRDCEAERIVVPPCNLANVVGRAELLSAKYRGQGHRSFDILLVAAALEIEADRFLSFDTQQRRLAQAEGLDVGP